ncbi:ferric reductase-like transmembrane domain-containing protein [Streptomyces sp. RB6PN25]|uniref:Ferric reductase-like transmembrane domain-containing protein n=1 Tax=Streptomyces humicola TaxID=2953240 RepID=A0ABT1PWI1_9ACTN|nr:ferric reductase-like transmembrane domain-containing protein [Streptomyces humicola]MCQ4082038.1 ferric reductase-like transmembrane domain-containing protein [Streptomyces humicola]
MTSVVRLGAASLPVAAHRPLWFATRASGSITLLLLTAAVALGVLVSGRYAPKRFTRFEISALHRNVSVLSLAFLAVHIVTTVVDPLVPVGWVPALVPFISAYRAPWLGLATLASDLMLAVAITSAVRLRMGRRPWKAVHWLAYAAWPVALFHAAAGTDTHLDLQRGLYAACVAAVLAAVWWRLYRAGPGMLAGRLSAGVVAALVPAALGAFLASGPQGVFL